MYLCINNYIYFIIILHSNRLTVSVIPEQKKIKWWKITMILIKWVKSRIRKKRCKYGLYFSGHEGNAREARPKNRGTKGNITHPNYEEAGEGGNRMRPKQTQVQPKPNSKTKIQKLIVVSPRVMKPMISRNSRQKTPDLMAPLMKKLETQKMSMMPMEMAEQILIAQIQESPKESKYRRYQKDTIPQYLKNKSRETDTKRDKNMQNESF